MGEILNTKLITETASGSRIKSPAVIEFTDDGKIVFIKSPFALKDEIKSMAGARWHGFDPEKPRKVWSVKDCQRNRLQLQFLMGQNPLEWFDRDIIRHTYTRPLMLHQKDMADLGLTYHYQIWAADLGTGKSLAGIELMEKSERPRWFWVGPKSGLMAAEREFKKWNISNFLDIEVMTYEGLVKRMKNWEGMAPNGVIFDEASRLKNHTAQRSQAAQMLADGIRADWGADGYVILMSGTPAPKAPIDWWSLAEICYPGWLKEGHPSSFEKRLAFIVQKEGLSGVYPHRIGWKDNENKCSVCGQLELDGPHDKFAAATEAEAHVFQPSVNECAYLYERLKGLVVIKNKKDCLDLPEKQYRLVRCEPTPSVLRVAKSLLASAPNVITGMTWLRELSDGFQYRDKVVGKTTCPACTDGKMNVWIDPDDDEKTFQMIDYLDADYVATLSKVTWPCGTCGGSMEVDKIERITREVPCPKEAALIDLLEENEEQGRIVIFAGFTGSVDRVTSTCQKQGWHIVRMDGRGAHVFTNENVQVEVDPLDYWANIEGNPRVAFIAHPQSGGMGLTLTESRMSVFYSNDFNPESRSQAEDRIHRIGMDMNRGATIVDLVHLPTDERVLEVLRDNRRLERMTLGEITNGITWNEEE
jgi:SNF2 family DNA or RNA helicase